MKWSALTTPPPPRPPSPKHPLFTTKFFSTKSFGPGHLVGAAALVFGVVGITKLFVDHGREEADRERQRALPSRPLTADTTRVQPATNENARGQYGRKP